MAFMSAMQVCLGRSMRLCTLQEVSSGLVRGVSAEAAGCGETSGGTWWGRWGAGQGCSVRVWTSTIGSCSAGMVMVASVSAKNDKPVGMPQCARIKSATAQAGCCVDSF